VMRRVLLGVLLLALTVILGRAGLADVWWLLRSPGPALSGTLLSDGVAEPVKIVRDRYAHVHVSAVSEIDAFFGLGFAHAQDRLWQMELLRRTARGRAAALFGPGAVAQDRVARTLGLAHAAEIEAQQLPDSVRELLEAYAAGVNAWLHEIRMERAALPGELIWLDVSVDNWTVADSLAILRLRQGAEHTVVEA